MMKDNNSEHQKIFWNKILPEVEKPSRYLGTEWNSTHKEIETVQLRIALVFPDLYELGLGNLGLHILYSLLNEKSHIWAERVYAPAPDLEQLLRKTNYPLFLWESKDPLNKVDLVGFTLQSELTYTTVLNLLDLAHLPLFSRERTEEDPLICAGGPCCYNPEPMSPFFDFFVIGDAEELIFDITDILLRYKSSTRREKLEHLAQLDGIYVPSLYSLCDNTNGIPIPHLCKKIRRAVIPQLTSENYLHNYIVPYTSLVHEGLSIEVMRGCTRGCRFCLAGGVSRPVRERSPEQVQNLLISLLPNTGLETVSLVSLSTCDHSQIGSLLEFASNVTKPTMTGIALPSLRLDSFSVQLADAVSSVRRSGLTFAPEAGSERLRKIINKSVTDDELIEIIRIAFQKGWTHVKLYFMIGLPTETDEDIDALIALTIRCYQEARKIRHTAHIHLGISTFVPKPWTPFQWCQQISLEETKEKQRKILRELKKYKAIKISFHAPESSFIEGLLSRGDRRISDVILSAWRNGAKLETSADLVHIEHWSKALEEHNLRAEEFLRSRNEQEPLPWDYIDPGIEKEWLYKEWLKAKENHLTPDCRETHCHLCGIQKREDLECVHWQKKEEAKTERISKTYSESTHRKSVQRLMLNIGKVGPARFLSHLEFQTAWIRIFRRAQLPVVYSQGYHAHARVSLALPAPVGETVMDEYLETYLYREQPVSEIKECLSLQLPPGFLISNVQTIPLLSTSLMERVKGIHYALLIQTDQILDRDFSNQVKEYIFSQLHSLTSNRGLEENPFVSIIAPHASKNGTGIYTFQWLTPIIKGKFIKPNLIKTFIRDIYPTVTVHALRIKTYLDTLPQNITPLSPYTIKIISTL